MEFERDFIFYTEGTTDKALKPDVEYSIAVTDAVYSPVNNKVQVLYTLEDTDAGFQVELFQEYDPLSETFKTLIDNVFYVVEGSAIKKVCIDRFKECCFWAKLDFSSGKPEIDWTTAIPEVSCISEIGRGRAYDNCFVVEACE